MIYVGLPDSVEERVSIMQLYLEADHNLSKSDWKKLGKVTQGMSASDLEKVSKKTWSLVKDEMLRSSNFKETGHAQGKKIFCPISEKCKKGLRVPYEVLVKGKNVSVVPNPVSLQHVLAVLSAIRPSTTPELLQKYKLYNRCGFVCE